MAANSVILLNSTVHSNDSTSSPLVGEKFKGAGFYGLGDGFHTVQVQLTLFTGIVKIQGSLATDPSDDDWIDINFSEQGRFSVDTTGLVSNEDFLQDINLTNSSINKTYNFTGNFVWVRANVTYWTGGQINRVLLNF